MHLDGMYPDEVHSDRMHPNGMYPDGRYPDEMYPDAVHPGGVHPARLHPGGIPLAGISPACMFACGKQVAMLYSRISASSPKKPAAAVKNPRSESPWPVCHLGSL